MGALVDETSLLASRSRTSNLAAASQALQKLQPTKAVIEMTAV